MKPDTFTVILESNIKWVHVRRQNRESALQPYHRVTYCAAVQTMSKLKTIIQQAYVYWAYVCMYRNVFFYYKNRYNFSWVFLLFWLKTNYYRNDSVPECMKTQVHCVSVFQTCRIYLIFIGFQTRFDSGRIVIC